MCGTWAWWMSEWVYQTYIKLTPGKIENYLYLNIRFLKKNADTENKCLMEQEQQIRTEKKFLYSSQTWGIHYDHTRCISVLFSIYLHTLILLIVITKKWVLQRSSVLRFMHWADSKVWGESFELHPVGTEAEQQGEWGGFWREVMQRGYRNVCMCYFYLLSLHTVSQRQRSMCLEINSFYFFLLYVWEWASLTPVQVQPSVFSPGSCIPWRRQRERRHTGHNATQTWRNPKKMSRDVRVGQVRASLWPVFHRSGELWIHMERVGVFCCLEWLMCLSFFFFFDVLTSSDKPQNRWFFSGRDVRL